MKILILSILSLLCHTTLDLYGQSNKYFTSAGRKIDVNSFDADIRKMIEEMGVPAVSLAVINNNEIVYSNTYGVKSTSKNNKANKNTVFESCSLGKSFLVFVVLKMAEEGKLDLDKPVFEYLPNQKLEHDPRYKLITPRMIISHTSGLENWQRYNDENKLEILKTPGEAFTYSGEGINYLAAAIEAILGRSYAEYVNDMIIGPLDLDRTFLNFKSHTIIPFSKGTPSNFATGHNSFAEEFTKFRNSEPIAAGGINQTAEDYAKLFLATFDGNFLSEDIRQEILKPAIYFDDSTRYMGHGYAVLLYENDTIISFSGNNRGYKGEILYSTISKNGFVFFSNSDRGKLMTSQLNSMSARLPLGSYFKGYFKQYPSKAIQLLQVYREKSSESMFKHIAKMHESGKIDEDTMNELGDVFLYHDLTISKNILEMSIKWYPNSATAYCLMGHAYKQSDDTSRSYKYFLKAKALGFDLWNIDRYIQEYENSQASR